LNFISMRTNTKGLQASCVFLLLMFTTSHGIRAWPSSQQRKKTGGMEALG
jgi:hypothetical protein